MKVKQAVILFHTSSHAIRAEKILQHEGIKCRLVPVPRLLSSDCGVCIRLAETDQQAAGEALSAARIEMAGHAVL